MIVILLFLSVVFLGIGLLINPSNATYLLAGYNTLTPEKQARFALIPYLKFFKKVHIFLAFSTLFVGLFLHFTFPGDAVVYWLVFYPLVFYCYILWRSQKFYPDNGNKPFNLYVGMAVLGLSILGIAGGLFYAHQPNQLHISPDSIEITGAYGAHLDRKTTQVQWVDSIPKLRRRINGIATQRLKKGYFSTLSRKKIKVLISSRSGAFIVFRSKGEVPFYYQLPKNKAKAIYTELHQKGWIE